MINTQESIFNVEEHNQNITLRMLNLFAVNSIIYLFLVDRCVDISLFVLCIFFLPDQFVSCQLIAH